MASKFKREFKNVVYNYTDAEAKVREATSNDPWGPSSAVMTELSDYTYHIEAYSMVMGMLWKRLNDHGKNWRHVYKALVVLEYLIKTGSERVLQQCKDNLFSIQTLKDFQYLDKDGKDQGVNIREKAKSMVALLKDEERLHAERERAIQARERQGGISSDGSTTGTPKGTPKSNKKVQLNVPEGHVSPEPGQNFIQPVEQARPTGAAGEEDMQLKLAIQLSKQQAEEEEKLKTQEEESLKAALELSKVDCETNGEEDVGEEGEEREGEETQESGGGGNLLLDFDTSGLGDPWKTTSSELPPPSYDMILGSAATTSIDPWVSATAPPPPPIQTSQSGSNSLFDPWGSPAQSDSITSTVPSLPSVPTQSNQSSDPWDLPPVMPSSVSMPTSAPEPNPPVSFNPFDLSTLDPSLPSLASTPFNVPETETAQPKRVEDDFLGELAQLVNLDTLTNPIPQQQQQQTKSTFGSSPLNPFGNPTGTTAAKSNPFEVNKPVAPTLNELANANNPSFTAQQQLAAPLIPTAGGPSPGGSPSMQRHQQQPQAMTNGNNSSYNPFS